VSETTLLQRARVVLVRPQLSANVGSAARVMRNLGLRDLVLVAPEADPLDQHARQLSTHGESILEAARIVPDLREAVADCVLVAATSARLGGLRRSLKVGLVHELMPRLAEALPQGPIALVFGPERTGLENDEVERCHYLLHIDTDSEYPALNLAQAVAITLHELRSACLRSTEVRSPALTEPPAPFADFERACDHLRVGLEEIRYLHGDKADTLMQALRHLLSRAMPTAMEVRLLFGLARQLRWAGRHLEQAGVLTRSLKPSQSAAPRLEGGDRPTVAESAAANTRESMLPSIPGYEIGLELGRGGVGVVYRAHQLALKRDVALKMILSGPHASATQLARFRAEAEAIASLQHPNIVQIYEVGEVDGHPYLALELIEGGNVAQHLHGQPVSDFKGAAQLLETLAHAIHYAHQKGIVHRDLKPANVLIADCGLRIADCDGESAIRNPQSAIPKITDFGLAKRLEDSPAHTRTGEIMGTPGYMAPEQAGGRKELIGPATDVYALGAILYEMLTGRPPFGGDALMESLMEVIHNEPVSVRTLNPGVPPDLEVITLKCLQKEPSQRYATAQALADDLGRFQRDEPIVGRRPGWWFRLRRWARHNPAVTAMLLPVVYLNVFEPFKAIMEHEEHNPFWVRFTGFVILPALPMASLVMVRALSKASRRTWVLRGFLILGLVFLVGLGHFVLQVSMRPLADRSPVVLVFMAAIRFVVNSCVLGAVLGVVLTGFSRAVRWLIGGDPRDTMTSAVYGMLVGPFAVFAGLTVFGFGFEDVEIAAWTALGSVIGSVTGAAIGAWRSRLSRT